jgi:septal ring factor EnvC (AmiA/AmiB activator)
VLKIFDKEGGEGSDSSQASAPSESLRSSCLDSPRTTRKIRRIVSQGVAAHDARKDRTIRLLGDAYLGASVRAKLAEEREQGLLKSIDAEKNKRKRGRAFTEQLRADEGLGVLFFSPSKVVKARELAAAQEYAKDDEALDRLLQAQDRAQLKARKELEARQKREDRAIRAVARKTKEALNKAQRERDKLAKNAQSQLQTESSASKRRPRGIPPEQKQPQEPVVVVIEPEVETVPEQPRSRTGRAIKRPRLFDDI